MSLASGNHNQRGRMKRITLVILIVISMPLAVISQILDTPSILEFRNG